MTVHQAELWLVFVLAGMGGAYTLGHAALTIINWLADRDKDRHLDALSRISE